MCLCCFTIKEVDLKPKTEPVVLEQLDDTYIWYDPYSQQYYYPQVDAYNPQNMVINTQPAVISAPIAWTEPVEFVPPPPPPPDPTPPDPTPPPSPKMPTPILYKAKAHIPESSKKTVTKATSNHYHWQQPKGKGYGTVDEAIAGAKKAGLKIKKGAKIHVMPAEDGGYFVVGAT